MAETEYVAKARETEKLMSIAVTHDPCEQQDKELGAKMADTRMRAGLAAVYDLKEAGRHERLWGMQSDKRLETEVRMEAGLAAVDAMVMEGKAIILRHQRDRSPFPEVNLAIREAIVLDELRGKDLKSWDKEHYFRCRMAQLRPQPARQPQREIARA